MNKNQPDISIIVPVYKAEAYIERCAKSLFEQSFSSIEYIFVDDCTPDTSIEILHQALALYPQRVPYVKIINHERNKGTATARNSGLLHATGKYIGWVDSDDWVDMVMFEQLYAVAVKHDSDIVWCDFYLVDKDLKFRQSQYCVENKVDFIKSLLAGIVHGGIWNSIIKRELYVTNNIRFPDGLNTMEDKLVLVKLLSYAEKIQYLPEAFYYYVKDNTNSITLNWWKDLSIQEAAQANLLAMLDFLNNSDLRIEMQKYLHFAKLIFKKCLLNSLDIKSFQQWKMLFEEENSYVLSCPNMTLKQKVLGWSVCHGWWFVVQIWIFLKKSIINMSAVTSNPVRVKNPREQNIKN